jgi:NAD(P)-dependent dehydrogenase (short-subunit alcohol dehydrogenase family)
MTARDIKKAEEVKKDILSDGGPGKVDVLHLDLGSLESVRSCAAEFLRKTSQLHILVLNAGGFIPQHESLEPASRSLFSGTKRDLSGSSLNTCFTLAAEAGTLMVAKSSVPLSRSIQNALSRCNVTCHI